ncbi:hypothetical protein [Streptomyces sp. BRA346]|uniref:hypothetical protein n=1 Tax=Streptomyces sp. BRA346 TaxID=2878199 RepID=UPI0040630E56
MSVRTFTPGTGPRAGSGIPNYSYWYGRCEYRALPTRPAALLERGSGIELVLGGPSAPV